MPNGTRFLANISVTLGGGSSSTELSAALANVVREAVLNGTLAAEDQAAVWINTTTGTDVSRWTNFGLMGTPHGFDHVSATAAALDLCCSKQQGQVSCLRISVVRVLPSVSVTDVLLFYFWCTSARLYRLLLRTGQSQRQHHLPHTGQH
jgi:hypothetical protein